jgi:hypothetical protein
MWAPEKGEKEEVAIFATGPLLYNALLAAKELEKTIQCNSRQCAYGQTAR